MSSRSCRRFLWITLVLAMPVLLVSPLQARIPAGRILMLAAISLLEMVLETSGGAVVPLTLLLAAQGLVAVGLLWVLAYVVSRFLEMLSARVRAGVVLAMVFALLIGTASVDVYRDPFRADTIGASLIDVYQ